MNNYARGSKWRKWDLQIQPIKNAWFKDLNENLEKVRSSVQAFIDKAIEKQIEVIGITDHNTGISIDYAIEYSKGKNIAILPGIELDANSGEHILIIFNPAYKSKLKKDKWSEVIDTFLQTKCQIEPPFFYNGAAKKVNITTEELIKTINREEIGIVIFAHCTSKDGFFQRSADTGKRKFVCENFYSENGSFIFEIKEANKKNKIIEKLKGWKLNPNDFPIISSSDANEAQNIGKFFTWIKADPTFEGLKQIIYEPEDRVRIQEEKPEQKEPYQLIDFVQFVDSNSKKVFTKEKIYINQNLTTIIGGKSTGKSILLREIARTINPEEVKKRLEQVSLEDYKVYKAGKTLTDDFVVQWVDEKTDRRSDINRDDYRKIIYIPQSYLNRLAEKEEDKSPIDELVENILKENAFIKAFFENLQRNIFNNNRKINETIEKLLLLNQEYGIKLEEIKNVGDKKGIEKFIKSLEEEINDLQKKANLTNEEIQKFNNLKKQYENLENRKENFLQIKRDFEKIKELPIYNFSYEFEEIIDKYNSVKNKAKNLFDKATKDVLFYIDNKLKGVNFKLSILDTKINDIKKELKPLTEKVDKNKLLQNKIEKLKKEKRKVKIIKEKNNDLKEIEKKIELLIDNLADYFLQYYIIKKEFKNKIEENYKFSDNLELKVKIKAKNKQFGENFINEIFDLRKLPDEYKTFEFNIKNEESLKLQIKNFINQIIKKEIEFKNRYKENTKEILQKLLKDWFLINYEITYDGDTITEMSPGKKSFVLLRLIIELDKSKCPLLIDQPEDDLDNRSVYNDVMKFIKERKKERQIIIATHNPNLVVTADAECVIVANQHGEKTKNKEYQFEYVQGSLENTFFEKGCEEILYKKGIREHVCEILEGGIEAFTKREEKYNTKTKIKDDYNHA